jgi:hypothetical protein
MAHLKTLKVPVRVTVKLRINRIPGHRCFHDIIVVGDLRPRHRMLEETVAVKTNEMSECFNVKT